MKNFRTSAIWTGALLCISGASALAQTDSGVRGGTQNTAGYLQYRGIPIPHPPVISPNPTTGATITANELALFNEGVTQRADGLLGHGDAPVLSEVVETPRSQDRTLRPAMVLAVPPAAALYRASGLVVCWACSVAWR
jgi:hypothetical protein